MPCRQHAQQAPRARARLCVVRLAVLHLVLVLGAQRRHTLGVRVQLRMHLRPVVGTSASDSSRCASRTSRAPPSAPATSSLRACPPPAARAPAPCTRATTCPLGAESAAPFAALHSAASRAKCCCLTRMSCLNLRGQLVWYVPTSCASSSRVALAAICTHVPTPCRSTGRAARRPPRPACRAPSGRCHERDVVVVVRQALEDALHAVGRALAVGADERLEQRQVLAQGAAHALVGDRVALGLV